MSAGLERACDHLLSSTSIISHEYGIPSISQTICESLDSAASDVYNRSPVPEPTPGLSTEPTTKPATEISIPVPSQGSKTELGSAEIDSELLFLEATYHSSFNDLTSKLNELLYLNKLSELNKLSASEIDSLYTEKIANNKQLLPSTNLNHIEDFYRAHNEQFKNKILLNNYLLITLPILRSIHHSDANLTITEINILKNLKRLYSKTNEHDDANINNFISHYKDTNKAQDNYLNLRVELSDLLDYELKPQLKKLRDITKRVQSKQDELYQLKHSRISQFGDDVSTKTTAAATSNDTGNENEDFDDNGDTLADKLDRLRVKSRSLVEKWARISIFCDLLPNLIMCNPTNWFNDKKLFGIIHDCENIASQFSSYQSMMNIQNIDDFSIEDLLMIDLDELNVSDYEDNEDDDENEDEDNENIEDEVDSE